MLQQRRMPEPQEPPNPLKSYALTLPATAVTGALTGVASAAFLWWLDVVSHFQFRVGWLGTVSLVFALPFAGALLGSLWDRFAPTLSLGAATAIDVARTGQGHIAGLAVPLVVVGSLVTHLFRGSAGREGTAVSLGAGIGEAMAGLFRLSAGARRDLLVSGIAGGFGAVFGTPLAGVVFALEVTGTLRIAPFLLSVLAALIGHAVVGLLGIVHTGYPTVHAFPMTASVGWRWLLFALAVAATSRLFVALTRHIASTSRLLFPRRALRLFIGGVAVVVLVLLSGTERFLGLGLETIEQAFHDSDLAPATFVMKLLFTAVTVGTGFVGGEVTPLFFIGASLGNALARALTLPLELGAAVGLASTFGAAAGTPFAVSMMAAELFGVDAVIPVLLVSIAAKWMMHGQGIYPWPPSDTMSVGERLDEAEN